MTYRQKLQQFIIELDLAYDKAGSMRDNSFDQQIYNEVRRGVAHALTHLKAHDNSLTDGQAACNVD